MNRTILFAAFAASVALAGCGGGGSTAPLTGTDAASALGKVASMDTDDIPAASPDMSPSPCPHPAWDAKPGGPPRPKPDGEIRNARPVHGVVGSVDATTETFVIVRAAKPIPPENAPAKPGEGAGGDKHIAPAVTITTDSATIFVRKNGKDKADTTLTFADIAVGDRVLVRGAVSEDTKTCAAKTVEVLPAPP